MTRFSSALGMLPMDPTLLKNPSSKPSIILRIYNLLSTKKKKTPMSQSRVGETSDYFSNSKNSLNNNPQYHE